MRDNPSRNAARATFSDHDRLVLLEQDADVQESFMVETRKGFTRILLWIIGTMILTVGEAVVGFVVKVH